MDEKQILTDPMVKPEDNVLESVLGKKYKNYNEFVNKLNTLGLIIEWNYYNDGKTWLGKILLKKKNICWLSIWNTGFKLTFYFSEKTIEGVYELDIDNEIKKIASEMKPVGKLRPIMLLVENKKKVIDCIEIIEYKMSLK
jgi:hypothetical protein